MFDRLTDSARAVMKAARQAATEANHDWVGTEHFLLGLLALPKSIAMEALRQQDIDVEEVERSVRETMKPGKDTPVVQRQLPFTPHAKQVLELSLEEAKNFGHNYIGSEHLALGLVRVPQGVAGTVLRRLGVNALELRSAVGTCLAAANTHLYVRTEEIWPIREELRHLRAERTELQARIQDLEDRMRRLEGAAE